MSQILKECKMAFSLLDQKNAKELNISDLGKVLDLMGYQLTSAKQAEYEKHLQKFDINKLVEIVEKDFNHLNEDAELIRAFKEFDPFFSGSIVVEDFTNIMMNMGDSISQQEVDELIKLADPNKTGKIDYNTFSKLLIESIRAQ